MDYFKVNKKIPFAAPTPLTCPNSLHVICCNGKIERYCQCTFKKLRLVYFIHKRFHEFTSIYKCIFSMRNAPQMYPSLISPK